MHLDLGTGGDLRLFDRRTALRLTRPLGDSALWVWREGRSVPRNVPGIRRVDHLAQRPHANSLQACDDFVWLRRVQLLLVRGSVADHAWRALFRARVPVAPLWALGP